MKIKSMPCRRMLRVTALLLGLWITGCLNVACHRGPTDPPDTDPPGATEAPSLPPVTTEGTQPQEETSVETETEAPPSLSAVEVAEALRSTIYRLPEEQADACGLADPWAVGIDEAALNRVLYPAPDDESCRVLVNVAEYGITPESEDNSQAFARMMTDLSDAVGRVKVVFPVGVYRFSSTLKISGVSRFTLCSDTPGTPFTILMTDWVAGVRVSDSSDILLTDYAFTYETPTAVAGTILSATEDSVILRVDDGFDLSHSRYNGGVIAYGSYMEMKQDEQTGDYYPDADGNLLYNSTGDQVKNISGGSYDPERRELTLQFQNKLRKPKEGTKVCVAFTMYENFGLYVERCEDVKLEGVHLYHTAGMAVGMNSCHNVYLNRVFLSPKKDSGMLMTATADGFHCVNCTGEILMTSCVFEKSHDDCMNVNGRYLSVTGNRGSTLTVEALVVPVTEGDELALYAKEDLHYLGRVKVKAISGNDLTCEGVTADMTNCFAANITGSPSLTVRNCFFGNKRNRGMLIQVRHVLIENCVFRNIVHGPIQVFTVPSSFGEGICPEDVTIRNNKFIGNDSNDIHLFSWSATGKKSPGVICKVDIRNNYFHRSLHYPVTISTGGEVRVEQNLFDTVCTGGKMTQKCVVNVSCSRDVTISHNAVLFMPERFKFVDERAVGRDKQSSNILFEDNTIFE